jgi:pimeloyl-ACP methyl ester carboxylesterase
VARPRILLCPQFTELEWAIAPQLAEWAEVATFDAPGVGDEPLPVDLDLAKLNRDLVVRRGLEEVEKRGWDSYFVVGDAWGSATAVHLALEQPEPVLGLALGHAAIDYDTQGERAAVNGEVAAAMGQLLRTDYDSFVRFGITQFTQGGFDEDLAARMIERFPSSEVTGKVWDMFTATPEPIGEMLGGLEMPMLLAKHEGCLVFTSEGYDDLVMKFPGAHQVSMQKPGSASEEFAAALRDFCESVLEDR